jgi:hypothetical protein
MRIFIIMEINGQIADTLKQVGVTVTAKDGSNYIAFPWVIREEFFNDGLRKIRRISVIDVKNMPPDVREQFKKVKL